MNLDDEFIVRTSNDRPRTDPGAGSYWVSRLRMDSEQIPLVLLCVMRVGEPMLLVLEIRRDGIPRFRPTTP